MTGPQLRKCQRQVPEAVQSTTAVSDPRGECFSHCHWPPSSEQAQITAHTFQGTCAAWHCQGTCDLEPTPLGECNLPLAVATSYRPLPPQALPTFPNCVCHFPPPPGLSKWVSPDQPQPLLLPPFVWTGNRQWRAAHKKCLGQQQRWAPGAMWPNRTKGICSCSSKSSGVNPCHGLGKPCICGISQ